MRSSKVNLEDNLLYEPQDFLFFFYCVTYSANLENMEHLNFIEKPNIVQRTIHVTKLPFIYCFKYIYLSVQYRPNKTAITLF